MTTSQPIEASKSGEFGFTWRHRPTKLTVTASPVQFRRKPINRAASASDVARISLAIDALIPGMEPGPDVDACGAMVSTFQRFRILASIADGRERPRKEILSELADVEESNFSRMVGLMARAGLLTRRRRGGGTAATVSLAVTADRLRACRAFADRVALIAGSVIWADPCDVADARPEPFRPPAFERCAIGMEETRILEKASPEWALAYQALHQLPVSVAELVALNVADVDLAGCRLRIAGRGVSVALSDAAWQTVRVAQSERKEGVLFLTPRGRRWSTGHLRKTWRELAVKTGLPPEVRFLTRRRSWTFRR